MPSNNTTGIIPHAHRKKFLIYIPCQACLFQHHMQAQLQHPQQSQSCWQYEVVSNHSRDIKNIHLQQCNTLLATTYLISDIDLGPEL